MPDITLTLTAQAVTRVQAAVAAETNNPTPDINDAKAWIIDVLKKRVQSREHRVARAAIADPADVGIT